MTDLIDTTEMYLRTILELEEEAVTPLRARISERLGHSGPTVSQTVARMERDGLVVVSNDRHLELTAQGRLKAVQVMRKHRLAERLLHEVIGLEWEYVHDEACRWEHVMSERVEKRIVELLQTPRQSPYGNPIPGLEELGVQVRGSFEMPVTSVLNVFTQTAVPEFSAQISRFAEPLQLDSVQLRAFAQVGLLPGKKARFAKDSEKFLIFTESGKNLEISKETASYIFVYES